jgi:SEC-C motif
LDFVDLLEKAAKATPDRQRRARRTGPDAPSMLVWQRAELAALVQRWPLVFADASGYPAIEARLRSMKQEEGTSKVTLVLGRADGLAAYLAASGGDPAEEDDRLAYADEAAEQGLTMMWPPGRNEPCWCGSDRKYKKCCALGQHA